MLLSNDMPPLNDPYFTSRSVPHDDRRNPQNLRDEHYEPDSNDKGDLFRSRAKPDSPHCFGLLRGGE